MNKKYFSFLLIPVIGFLFWKSGAKQKYHNDQLIAEKAQFKSFVINVKTVGELEAAHSKVISSCIRGDQGKIIYLIKDGTSVERGDLLVKMDPTPFEEKVDELTLKLEEQKALVEAHENALNSERCQAEHECRIAISEVDSAQLELNKIVHGDGPLEISKLQAALQKARVKYEELEGYSEDLEDLQEKGYLNIYELNQARKKLAEEKDSYESAKLQYETYINHVYPMQVKKAESQLKRAKLKYDETLKLTNFKVIKATVLLEQAKKELINIEAFLKNAQKELLDAEIRAETAGMVVLRDEYRMGEKRKPRLGDVLIKNQPLLDLPDLSSMMVKTKVREVDLYKIDLNKPALIEVDAYPNLQFTGRVKWIGVLALPDSSRFSPEKFFEVKIALDSSDPRLRPGMTARVTIEAASVENTLSIPQHAVFISDRKPACYVMTHHKAVEKRPIELGMGNEFWIEVKEGLQEGEMVCLTLPDTNWSAK